MESEPAALWASDKVSCQHSSKIKNSPLARAWARPWARRFSNCPVVILDRSFVFEYPPVQELGEYGHRPSLVSVFPKVGENAMTFFLLPSGPINWSSVSLDNACSA